MRQWPKLRSLKYYFDAFYPSRYFHKRRDGQNVSVFMFHDLDPNEFEAQLIFLKKNLYDVYSCDQINWNALKKKQVILTFDDGLLSVWTIAFPLLRKYGIRATAFVCPNNIPDGPVRPNIETADVDELTHNDFGNAELFNWNEAKAMHESGFVDIQLHGFAHSRIFTSDEIIDFENPWKPTPNDNIATWQIKSGHGELFFKKLTPGEPVFKYGSRWGSQKRFIEDEALRLKCIKYVEKNGGPDKFFLRDNWFSELSSLVSDYKAKHKTIGRFETQEEKIYNLQELIQKAQSLLNEKLGKTAAHFALPWAEGEASIINRAIESTGIKHIYWEHLSYKDLRKENENDKMQHSRLKEIFIRRLKGQGKISIVSLFLKEIIAISKYNKHNIVSEMRKR